MDFLQNLARRNANLSPHELQLKQLELVTQENQAEITKLAQQKQQYQETLAHLVKQQGQAEKLVSRLAPQVPNPQDSDQAVKVLTKVAEVVTAASQNNALVNAFQKQQKQVQRTAELRRQVAAAREALAKAKEAAKKLEEVTQVAVQVDQTLFAVASKVVESKSRE